MSIKIGYTKTSQVIVACVVSILAVATVVMSAAPLFTAKFVDIGDYTVLASSATIKDSLILAASDSAMVTLSASGVAVFDRAGETFTVGFGNTYSNHSSSNLESSTITAPRGTTGTNRVPFNLRWILYTDGALTDTYYVQTSCVSPGGSPNVAIEDLIFSATIGDRN